MLPVVVLAGGLATRIRPITETIPKCLIPINDVPFIIHQLSLFEKKGIEQVHFCLGYLGEMVERIVSKSKFFTSTSLKITFSFDGEKLLGTGGAVKKALNYLPESFFITYGDSYLSFDYERMYDRFISLNDEKKGLMAIYKNQNNLDVSNVIYNEGHVLYSKKNLDPRMEYIDYGLSILRKKHFENHGPTSSFDLADTFEQLSTEHNLEGYEVQNRFYEIGSFKGIEDLSNFLKK